MGKKGIFAFFGVLFLLVLIFCVYSIFGFSEKDLQFDKEINFIYSDEGRPETGILAEAKYAVADSEQDVHHFEEWEGRTNVIVLNEGDTAEWQVEVPETGNYELAVGYYPLEGTGQDIELVLALDGQNIEDEARPFKLNRVWSDEPGPLKRHNGNDLRPKQSEAKLWLNQKLTVPDDLRGEPLRLELTKGKHTLSIHLLRESMVLDYLHLTKVQEPAEYAAYQSHVPEYGDSGKRNPFFEVVQAERAYLKSSSGLLPTSDRTSPLTTPYDPVKIRMNTIGGSNWEVAGQWISWKFEVPETGWYKIGFRYRQSKSKGMFVSRTVYIDGEIPFSEMKHVRFPYGLGWKIKELGEETGEPYWFYLTKGSHEIKMQVTLGELADSVRSIQELIYKLNQIYLKIIMITGVSPDPYRDYDIDRSIPDLLSDFAHISDRMKEEADKLDQITGQKNVGSRSVRILARQLDSFVDRPDTIPMRLKNFKTNLTGLADWVLNAESQPLELDYLYIASPDVAKPQAEANLLEQAAHEIRAFAGSFLENYTSFSGNAQDERSIEVWVGMGRDQAYVLRRLIEESFIPETGINVKLNLVDNSLAVAVMAGKGPDISLLTKRGEVMNLAIRGALEPLDQFQGFEDLQTQYMPTAFVPYQYLGHTYAIPEEQEFFMMFYREDILKDLGIEPPQTWEDMLKTASFLQNNNMQIGLPYVNLDAFQLLDTGMGTLNLFPTLLMQNGSAVYNDEHTGTRFDEPAAYQAFKQWTDFYRLFDFPLYKDDFNRFRTGEMPVVITSYKLYNRLVRAAPEIAGMWKMVPIPGVRKSEGNIDRSADATGTAAIILKDADNKQDAWEFLKWWSRPDIQSQFTKDLESEMGVLGRRIPANLEAFKNTNWSRDEQAVLLEQWKAVREIPEIPGGYYTSRNIDNAFRDVIFQGENPRESLYYWNKQINEEIRRKRYEFGVDQ